MSTSTPLDDLVQDRTIIKTQLLAHLDDLPLITQCQFATYSADVHQLMVQLAPIHKDILKLAPSDEVDQHVREFCDIKRDCLKLLSHFQPLPQGASSPSQSNRSSTSYSHSSVRLPDIALPTFNGDQSLWPSFSARFTSIINRFTNLSDEDKLDYLQTAVKGEPKALIANVIPGSGTAFTEAWTILEQIFHNHRHTVDTIIRKLLEHPPAHDDVALRKFVETFRSAMSTLVIMKLKPEKSDYIWNTLILSKCDSTLRGNFEQHQMDDKIPPTSDLLAFIQKYLQAQAHSRTQPTAPTFDNRPKAPLFELKRTFPLIKKSRLCPECQLDHPIYKCAVFNKATVQDRHTIVKRHKLCTNCLAPGHTSRECAKMRCKTCDKPHHTLLHFQNASGEPAKVNVAANCSTVLLQTALIHVKGRDGAEVPMRAVLDGGATCSIITNDALQQIGIPTQPLEYSVAALGEREQRFSKGAEIQLSSWDGTFEARIPVFAMPKITGNVPGVHVKANWPHLEGLQLADPQFHIPARVDILLGSDFIPDILYGEMITHKGAPSAHKTRLGWVLQGKSPPDKQPFHRALLATSSPGPDLSRYWELEEVPSIPIYTIEEQKVEELFRETTKILQDGRFCVKLPLKNNPPQLGNSKSVALARFLSLEKKMKKDRQYAVLYKRTIQDYLSKGHMQRATESIAKPVYLPHHGVLNQKGKLRIVFDASAKTTNGQSLNDQFLNGPKTQQDLFSILTRFRTYAVAITADISQMYRQVKVHPEDYCLQRVLWRDAPSEQIQELELTVVTWGTKPAAYLATRCLKEIAERAEEYMPETASKIKNDVYVDDLLSGAQSIETARTLCYQVTQLLSNAGMHLHKWASNIRGLTPEQSEDTVIACDDSTALGIKWNHKEDAFGLQIAPAVFHKKITKRTILSDLGRVYDPLGWVAPALIKPKCFVQHLWKTSSSWDAPLPIEISKQWEVLMEDLQHLTKVKIPRLMMTPASKDIILCGFADASESAYSAVVYLRQSFQEGVHSVNIVAARTKVAPLKQVSLPRLELCGALLLARLIKTIINALPHQLKVVAFTDSTIALHWVRGHPSRWKTFVGHRVQEIQGILQPQCWRHVVSQENPADLATRQCSAADLVTHKLWWNGPQWLATDTWPPQPHLEKTSVPEERQLKTVVLLTTGTTLPLLTTCSSLSKLLRVLAYVRRAITPKVRRPQGPISATETICARVTLIKLLQRQHYERELSLLQAGKPVLKSSTLAKLTPYVDGEGLMRVGGRLQNAQMAQNAKHPIIIPYAHATKLIIRQYHHVHEHAGPQLLASIVAFTYYVPALRNITRFITRTCVTCARIRAKLEDQLMAQLPKPRVTPARPFNQCGVDFAGPFSLRSQLARGTKHYKAYVALFVCMSTRAIHLEVATSLSAEAFLAAFARLCARRSTPAKMFSDRGTNFTSASKILKDLQSSDRVTGYLAQNEVEWAFNPPSAPHWGGIWEAGVRSFKFHLAAITRNQILTYEEFNTVTCRIEAVLNSRPLTPVSTDPQDLEPLTPGHFLTGAPLTAPPERIEDDNLLPNQRWRLVQKIVQSFWQRWSSEYISRLNQRPKWCRPKRPVQVGDMVIIKEENTPPLKWRLGRIVDVHPGEDGLPRAVSLKTQFGACSRPVVKIARLPLDSDPEPNPPLNPPCVISAGTQPPPLDDVSDAENRAAKTTCTTNWPVVATTEVSKKRRPKVPKCVN